MFVLAFIIIIIIIRGRPYIHTCRGRIADERYSLPLTASAPSVEGSRDWRLSLIFAAARRFVQFWASRAAKFPKMGDSLPVQDALEPPCKIWRR